MPKTCRAVCYLRGPPGCQLWGRGALLEGRNLASFTFAPDLPPAHRQGAANVSQWRVADGSASGL